MAKVGFYFEKLQKGRSACIIHKIIEHILFALHETKENLTS